VAESALEQMKKIVSTTIETHQKRAERYESASVELKQYKKKADDAAAALIEFKNEIRAILDADNKELKKRCHDQNVRIFGGAAMKQKYAYALLENYINK
jgi:predicted metallo-beta-lactamase superfamily hydrolase